MSFVALFLKAHVAGYTRGDGVVVRAHERHTPPVVSFSSGASAPAIMRGYIVAGAPLGVSLTEMNPGSAPWDMMIEYARRGGQVFVDTGAFPAFTRGIPVDWDRNQRLVRQLIAQAPGTRFHIVMPDIIGDQTASLNLLARNAGYVRHVIAAGHDALVPIQKGGLAPYDAFAEAVQIIGTDDFTAAVPSNRAAFSNADLSNLMGGQIKPRRVHFLGVAGNKVKLAELAAIVHRASPTTVVTSDANRLRAKVGQGQPLTVGRQRAIEQLDNAFRFLIQQDHPELAEAWQRQGRDMLGAAGTTTAIHADEAKARRQRDLFG